MDATKDINSWMKYRKEIQQQLADEAISDQQLQDMLTELHNIADATNVQLESLEGINKTIGENPEAFTREYVGDFNKKVAFFKGKNDIIDDLLTKVSGKIEGREIVRTAREESPEESARRKASKRARKQGLRRL